MAGLIPIPVGLALEVWALPLLLDDHMAEKG